MDVCPGWKHGGRAQWDFPCLEPMQKPCGASSAGAQPSTAQRDGSEGRFDARNMSVVSRTTVPSQTLSRRWSLVWSVLVSVLQHWRTRAGGPWESYVLLLFFMPSISPVSCVVAYVVRIVKTMCTGGMPLCTGLYDQRPPMCVCVSQEAMTWRLRWAKARVGGHVVAARRILTACVRVCMG